MIDFNTLEKLAKQQYGSKSGLCPTYLTEEEFNTRVYADIIAIAEGKTVVWLRYYEQCYTHTAHYTVFNACHLTDNELLNMCNKNNFGGSIMRNTHDNIAYIEVYTD